MSGFGGAVKLTGESEYRAALKKITQNLKEVSSEMKLVSSSFDKNDKSVQALTAKQSALTQKLDQQKQKLSMIQTSYASMSKEYQDNQTKHEALVASYEREQAELERIGKELGTDSKEYQEQKKVVDALGKEVEDSTKAQNANEKALSNMRIEMNKSQADINKTEREMDKLDKELLEAAKAEEDAAKGADKLDKSLKETDDDTAKADKGFTVLKGTLANLAADAIQKCIDGMKQLGQTAINAWKEFDEGTDIIIAKTGASGEAAKELEGIYKNVASRVVASNDEIGTAVGEVSTRFGITGKDLDGLSTKFLKFSKLNNTDVNSSIDNTQKALSAFGLGAEDAGHVLDVFNKVGQDTGVSMDTLMTGLIQNGTAFQEMGLSIEDSVSLMGQMEKSGANSETVMNGLRKALKASAKDGIPLNEALIDLEDSIVNNTNETEGLNKAYEIFGKSGDQIYGALKNGSLSFKDIAGASLDFKNSVNKTFENTQDAPEKFDLAIQNIKMELASLTDGIMEKYAPQIETALNTITKVVKGVFKVIDKGIGFFVKNGEIVVTILGAMAAGVGAYVAYSTALTVMRSGWAALAIVEKATAAAQWALNAAMSANPIGLIIAGVVALVAAFVILWKKSEKFRNFWKGIWKTIRKAAEPVIKSIVNVFKKAWDAIKTAWSYAVSFFLGIWNGIKALFAGVKSFFSSIFLGAYNAIVSAWNGCVAFFTKIWSGIKAAFANVISFYKNLFLGAYNAIKAVWNYAASYFAGIWNGIRKALGGVATWFKNKFTSAYNAVKNVFGNIVGFYAGLWSKIKDKLSAVPTWFKDKFKAAWQNVKDAFGGFVSFFSGLWSKIKDKFSGLGTKIGSAISGAVKSAINKMIGKIEKVINSAIGLINGAIGIINKIPGVNVSRVGKVSFNRLAQGGVLKKGQVGVLEGSGAEAVVPLERNTKWIRKVADSFRAEMGSVRSQSAASAASAMQYDDAVEAFKDALSQMQIVLDDETAGKFVERTVTRYIYA